MTQMSAAANSATPTTSLTRRERVDPATVSDLHDDGQHKRPPPGTLPEKAAQLDAQFFLDEPLIRPFFHARLIDNVAEHARTVGKQHLTVLHDKPARDDVRHAFERARLLIDGDDRDDEAVFGEMPAVAQHLVADFTGPRVVDQHASDRRFAGEAAAVLVECDD